MRKRLLRMLSVVMAVAVIFSMTPLIDANAYDDDEGYESFFEFDEVDAGTYESGIKLTVYTMDMNEDMDRFGVYIKRPGSTGYSYVKSIDSGDYDDYDDGFCTFKVHYRTSKTGTYKFKLVAYDYDDDVLDTIYKTYTFVKLSKPSIATKAVSNNRIKVSWKKVAKAKGYKVYRSASKNGTYRLVKTIKSGSTVSYVNKTPSRNKKYYYRVRAYTKVNGEYKYSPYSSKKSSIAGVLKPSIKSISGYSGRVSLKWSRNSRASGYVIYRSTSKYGTYRAIKTIKKNSITSYKDWNVYSGSKYYYKVKAYKYINGRKYYSYASKVKGKTVTSLSYTYTKARKAYKALKNDCVYYPSTLQVNYIYSGKLYGDKVILIDFSSENAYGVRIRNCFTYWTGSGYWVTSDYHVNDLTNVKTLSKSKVMY